MSRSLFRLAFVFVAIGLAARVLPLFDLGGRLLRQFPTEDGYLMLTVARNMAIGNGMSIADGTIQTNGIQPLATFLYAVPFMLTGGGKVGGVLLVLMAQLMIITAAAFVLFLMVRWLLNESPSATSLAALFAAIWFAASVVTDHSMNCLESGLQIALSLVAVYSWLRFDAGHTGRGFNIRCLWVGLWLGAAFWARIDAVFLIATVTVLHLWPGLSQDRAQLRRRLGEAVAIGLTTIVIASPWLTYNYVSFGSVMPVSGQAQSIHAALFSNASAVPPNLLEYISVVFRLPWVVERSPAASSICLLAVAFWVYLVVGRRRRAGPRMRRLIDVALLMMALVSLYYGSFFGAKHFISRYLFVLSPLLGVVTFDLVVSFLSRIGARRARVASWAIAASVLLVSAGLQIRGFVRGADHMHFQVKEWVDQNVQPHQWVGAIQTGTVGFFHNRTVNLDGKVNPEALRMRKEGAIPLYVAQHVFDDRGGRIDFLADWAGIGGWMEHPPISTNFDLILCDDVLNLAVLRRKGVE